MLNKVLQDHLLQMPVARMRLGQSLQRRDPLLLALPDPQ
jgi:hypothetical protein